MNKRITKYAIIISLAMLIVACKSETSKDSIKKQISEYKEQVNELNLKIKDLEKELENHEQGESVYNTPVEVNQITKRPFKHYFEASGSLEAVNKAYISPEINGQIKEILVVEGERVIKGQLLVKLNTSITESTIQEVETQLDLAKTLYEKQKQLWEKNIGSEVQYLQTKNNMEALESKLATLKAQLEMAFVRSPINGIVDMINVEPGELAMPGFQIMMVVNLDEMYVKADVSEKYLPVVKEGDEVELSFPTFPSLQMTVRVNRVGNIVNKGNRTFVVELKIKNVNGMLKPNVLALMKFMDYSNDAALIVPSIIIKEDIQGPYLYIVDDNGGKPVAKKVYINTGMSYKDTTMITSGLEVGDKVIIEGYSLVTDGTEVNIK
jgi:RND family efflux transporter MFP subunit